jgi:hypothetical protein
MISSLLSSTHHGMIRFWNLFMWFFAFVDVWFILCCSDLSYLFLFCYRSQFCLSSVRNLCLHWFHLFALI